MDVLILKEKERPRKAVEWKLLLKFSIRKH
jgi:hypothetical protein